ncbi:hypothetical protein IAT40_002337 [Kwoniella sp. CBS 6097]
MSPTQTNDSYVISDDFKEDIQHVEDPEAGLEKKTERDVEYDAQEGGVESHKGMRRLLRRNPSYEFIREVAIADAEPLDKPQVKRLEKRLWLMIVPALTLSYAALFGIRKDLKLVGTNYSTLSSIFYVGWLLWALPGNLLMAKFPLSKYLGINIFLWGVFLMAQGGANDFKDMLILRLISGAFEAVAKPGFMAITAMWFTRLQQPIVIGTWYASQGVGIGLGGLIGYGIGQIQGSIAAWRFEFIIIGAACAAWGIAMAYIIPDSPYTCKRFTRSEKIVIMSRKRDDYHAVEKRQLKWDQIKESALDVRTYLFFLLGLTANIPNGGTSNFGTLMTRGFGFNTLNTTLLQIPYGLSQTLFICASIYVNHKTHHLNIRTYLMAGILLFTVAGFAMMAYGTNQGTKLLGYYFTGASNATFSLSLSLVTGNVGGNTKKMIASAMVFIGVGLGNVIGPYAFFESQAPHYTTGVIVCMISRIAEIVVILVLRMAFAIPNRRRDKMFAGGDERYDPSVITYEDMSDKQNLHFRYLI